uniref:Minor capsid protein L2 n=1 Tax=Human papillomavirus 33 TaxID=10586 RepID=A0A159WJF8_HPV33|nr:minor capsid protein L2 [human papillomavirus 33]
MRHKRSTRRKRASATQLYQTCKATGTCPPDVIPKVEGSTIADQILKYGSLGVFFGGLGIGTGSGSGGRTGYVPIGTDPPTAAIPLQPIRPPVTVDTVGPLDSSIVSLIEETSFIEAGAPAPSIPTPSGFDVTTSADTTPAIINVSSVGESSIQTISTHLNPTFTEPSVLHPPAPAEASGHFIFSSPTVSTQSYENIPMDTFVVSTDSSNVTSSTPIPGSRPVARLGLYSRNTQQVKVVDPAFLTSPHKLITYDNPAFESFDPEDTLQFQHSDISPAPDPDFLDIIALHRPAITSRRHTVRFSRVGQKATLKTRSGKQIGARIHYYQDLSPIVPLDHTVPNEQYELQPLHDTSTSSYSINDGLYDVYADNVDNVHTPMQHSYSTFATTRTSNVSIPLNTGFDTPVMSGPDIPSPLFPTSSPFVPISPFFPFDTIVVDGADFVLHPSYFILRRRRKRFPYFFTDVRVAA